MQDVIIGERETGTIRWILSKPRSRTSFISSKLLSNSIGVIVSMVIVPGFVASLLIFFLKGNIINLGSFLARLVILSVLLLFASVPHGLFFPVNIDISLVTAVMLDLPVETYLPLLLTVIYIILFVIITLFKFNKEEF